MVDAKTRRLISIASNREDIRTLEQKVKSLEEKVSYNTAWKKNFGEKLIQNSVNKEDFVKSKEKIESLEEWKNKQYTLITKEFSQNTLLKEQIEALESKVDFVYKHFSLEEYKQERYIDKGVLDTLTWREIIENRLKQLESDKK